MENEEILQEEETSILTLRNERGEEINFAYLDCIEYNGVEYLALMPENTFSVGFGEKKFRSNESMCVWRTHVHCICIVWIFS